MNFLEEDCELSLKDSLQGRKPEEATRISSPFGQAEESPRKKNVHLR